MRVHLFLKIALVFLAMDSCESCEPENLECETQKLEDLSQITDEAEKERQNAIDDESLSEEEFQVVISFINEEEKTLKELLLNSSCD